MSVEVVCDAEGFEEFQAAMQRLDSALQDQVYRHLYSWASDVKAEAMRKSPIRTGYLRSSIYAFVKDWVVEIGAEAMYAMFVEFGTRYMMAQPFIHPAIQDHLSRLEDIILAAIDAAKTEAGLI